MLHDTMTHRGIAFLLAAALGTAACGSDRGDGSDAAGAGDTAAGRAAAPSAERVAVVDTGLQGPEGARWDPDQNVWFVSNVNGSPTGRDNNGFISRLQPDGAIDALKFIAGGRNKATLHAPKGMAIVGDTLWVADIDVVRGFNRKTGAPVASVAVPGARFLNDVASGPDGIYVTDTGVEFGPEGQATLPGPHAVYRIAGRKPTTVLKFEGQPGANGITWDESGSRFIIVPYQDQTIFAWTPGEATPSKIAEGPGMQDGVEPLGDGRFLFTAWADSSLSILSEGTVTQVAGSLPAAADLGFDRETGRVAVPLLTEDRVELLQLNDAARNP